MAATPMPKLTKVQATMEYDLVPAALDKEVSRLFTVKPLPSAGSSEWVHSVADSRDRDLLAPWERQRAESGRCIERSPGSDGFTHW